MLKIKMTKEIEIPDKITCQYSRAVCSALTNTENMKVRVCANFNDYYFWSDKAGFYVRCKQCVDAQIKYLREKN